MDSIGQGRCEQVVEPISILADLYSLESMDEEAIALYKQAYSIEKDSSGDASPKLAHHLQIKLAGKYQHREALLIDDVGKRNRIVLRRRYNRC